MDTTSKGSWIRDLSKNFTPLGRTGARGTLPVFFSADGRSALHAFAASSLAVSGHEEEAELARAAQATLEIAQATSRELLRDLHAVTKSLGFWETKLHDTPWSIWWFILLQTGPGYVGKAFHYHPVRSQIFPFTYQTGTSLGKCSADYRTCYRCACQPSEGENSYSLVL